MAIPYVKQTWVDNNVANPLSAARLGVLETGIFDAHYQPAVRAYHNAAQSVTSGTPLVLAFNSERIDQASNAADTMHDTSSNNSRLTCRYAGVYLIWGNVEWAANATGYRVAFIRHSVGATTIGGVSCPANVTGGVTTRQQALSLYAMAVNEYVELVVDQNSGGPLNVQATSNVSPEFGMVRVG